MKNESLRIVEELFDDVSKRMAQYKDIDIKSKYPTLVYRLIDALEEGHLFDCVDDMQFELEDYLANESYNEVYEEHIFCLDALATQIGLKEPIDVLYFTSYVINMIHYML